MARVVLEFDSNHPTDGKVYVDGEEVTFITHINLCSSATDETKLILSRLRSGENGKPIVSEDDFLNETYDVFDRLENQEIPQRKIEYHFDEKPQS